MLRVPFGMFASRKGVYANIHRKAFQASTFKGWPSKREHSPKAPRDLLKPQGGLRQHSPESLPSDTIQKLADKARTLTESPPGSTQAARRSTPTFTERTS